MTDTASRRLLTDFLRFAPARLAGAVGLVLAGAVLEAAGILMLVPLLDLALGDGGIGGSLGASVREGLAALGAESPEARLGLLLGVFVAAVLIRAAIHLRRDLALFDLTQRFIARLRLDAFRALAARPWRDLARIERDAVGHALSRDVDRVEGGAGAILNGLVAVVVIAVQLAIAAALAPLLTLGAVIAGAIGLRALRRLRARAARRGSDYSTEDLALFGTTAGFLSGLKPARAHGMEGAYLARFERALGGRMAVMRGWLLDVTVARLTIQSGAAIAAVLAVVAGVFWLDTPPATLVVLVAILARLYGPVQALQLAAQSLGHAAAGYTTARGLASEAPATKAPAVARPLDHAPGIAFEAVTVEADEPGNRPLLDGVTAIIPAGRVTALTGPSGAGKSTLADLAVGLIRPDRGQVMLDGAPLDGARVARLRAGLAWIGQEPFMPAATLRDALLWGVDGATDDRLVEALDIVGARPLLDAVGLDGPIRTDGTRFSGGERQRLRLARAWLRRPRFLVLDEATNALDADGEAAVLGRLFAALDGATVLMITHRPATAARADHLIRLDRGRAVAERTPLTAAV